MMKIIFLILILSISTFQVLAQSNQQIKRNSDNNRGSGSSGNPPSTHSNSSSNTTEGNENYNSGHPTSTFQNNGGNCDGACVELGCNVSLQLIPIVVNWQKKRLKKADDIGRIINFTGEGLMSVNTTPYFIAQPQISGTWGLLGSSIRYYAAVDNAGDLYNTLDWQLVELNFLQTKNFDFKMGTGFMKELFSNRMYWESTMAASFYSKTYPRLKINTTLRYANDGYEWAKFVPRVEMNSKIQYDIYRTNTWNWGAETGVLYGSNFGVEIWGVQVGIYYQAHHLEKVNWKTN